MVDQEQAKKIAEEYIKTLYPHTEEPIIIVDAATIERPYGWIFSYESQRYYETGDMLDALWDSVPLVVLKATGDVRYLAGGGGHPLSERLIAFELHYFNHVYELPEHLQNEPLIWDEPLWSTKRDHKDEVM